jgi:hypothetical protein
VDGVWIIQAAATKSPLSVCVSSLGLDPDTPVTISQSGKNFTINAGKAKGTGAIDGTTLQAQLSPAKVPAANCGNDGSVALAATLEAKASPRALSGVLSVAGCPSCESVEFHALKQASIQKKGGQ